VTDNPISPKITADQAVADLISLGHALHRFTFPQSQLGLTRPIRPQESARLQAEITELHRRVEVASADRNNRHLRSALEVVRDQIPDPMLVRVVAYASWHAIYCDPSGSSVANATRAASLGNIEDMLRVRFIIRRLIAKGETLLFKDGGFHGGDILPGGKINRLLTGNYALSALWTEETLKKEQDQAERSNGEVQKKSPPPHQTSPAIVHSTVQPHAASNLDTPKSLFNALRQTVIGADPAVRRFSVAMSLHLRRVALVRQGIRPTTPPITVLCVGESGVGKTFMVEEFCKLAGLPFTVGNLAEVTSSGFVGISLDDILVSLFRKGEKKERVEAGSIVFFDEADKRRSNDRRGDFDATGSGVQAELLRLLEGTDIQLGGRRANDSNPGRAMLSTHGMAFCLAGCFPEIESIMTEKSRSRLLGFGDGDKGLRHAPDVRSALTSYFLPELCNRISTILQIRAPGLDQLIQIASEPHGVLARQNQFLGSMGLILKPSEMAVREICAIALDQKTYARGVRSIFQAVCEEAIFEEKTGELAIGIEDVRRVMKDHRAESGKVSS